MNEFEWQLLEEHAPVASVVLPGGVEVRPGDRVRLRPGNGGDVMDLALEGKIALIESIEQDYEGAVHVSVVLDDDPGSDIGHMRQPGHRFFFRAQEMEALSDRDRRAEEPRILIAGIGNIFFGDDGFGVEVASRFQTRELPRGVQAIDFGIRSYDLAYALTSGRYDAAILVDAAARGGAPGDIYVLSAEVEEPAAPAVANAHTMNPQAVLEMARAIGTPPSQVLVVACEPETLGGEDGQMGLSEIAGRAVDRALVVIESLIARIRKGDVREN